MDTISKLFKDTTKKLFSGSKSLVLKDEAPSYQNLEKRFSEIKDSASIFTFHSAARYVAIALIIKKFIDLKL